MEKEFNKLVRDNITKFIIENGEHLVIHFLDNDEYRKELMKKLLEEANEVINSKKREEILEELADVMEVIRAIAILENSDLEEVIKKSNKKRYVKGGFQDRIFLKKTINNNE